MTFCSSAPETTAGTPAEAALLLLSTCSLIKPTKQVVTRKYAMMAADSFAQVAFRYAFNVRVTAKRLGLLRIILSARNGREPRFGGHGCISNVRAATHDRRGLRNSRSHACNTADRRPRSRPCLGSHTRDSRHNNHQRNQLRRCPRQAVELREWVDTVWFFPWWRRPPLRH